MWVRSSFFRQRDLIFIVPSNVVEKFIFESSARERDGTMNHFKSQFCAWICKSFLLFGVNNNNNRMLITLFRDFCLILESDVWLFAWLSSRRGKLHENFMTWSLLQRKKKLFIGKRPNCMEIYASWDFVCRLKIGKWSHNVPQWGSRRVIKSKQENFYGFVTAFLGF